MKLREGVVWTQVEASPEERSWLDQFLTFRDDKAYYRAKATGGDGFVRMFDGARFRSGLVPVVKQAVKEVHELEHEFDLPPARATVAADLGWLREYQLEAVEKITRLRRGVVYSPTGSGKTEIAIGCVLTRPARWLFLAHRDNLVRQAAQRYEKRTGRKPASVTGAGELVLPDGTVVGTDVEDVLAFATYNLVYKYLPSDAEWVRYSGKAKLTAMEVLLASFDGVIVDEVHTVASPGMPTAILNRCTRAQYRVGVSGTPADQGDLRSFQTIANIGPVRFRIDAATLIAAGHTSPGRAHFVPVAHPPPKAVTWQGVYKEHVVKSEARLRVSIACAKRAPTPFLVFVADLKSGHLRALLEGLRAAGLTVEPVSGSTVSRKRDAQVSRLRDGDLDGIVCTEVFQEGVDIPELRSVIIAAGEKSTVASVQRLGRGTRLAEDKDEFVIYDVYDYTVGPPEEWRTAWDWLENHSRDRAHAYRSQAVEVTIGELDEEPQPFPLVGAWKGKKKW